jgi:hypothetical protein
MKALRRRRHEKHAEQRRRGEHGRAYAKHARLFTTAMASARPHATKNPRRITHARRDWVRYLAWQVSVADAPAFRSRSASLIRLNSHAA